MLAQIQITVVPQGEASFHGLRRTGARADGAKARLEGAGKSSDLIDAGRLACDAPGMGQERTVGNLIDVRRARLVVIHDVWIGYNPHSPVAAIWELRRGPRGGLAGEARFSTALAGKRDLHVAISDTVAERFLNTIAGARVVPGSYEAVRVATDDYPHIEIAIHVGVGDIGESSGFALLFTESQGKFHAPWGICVSGGMFTIPGTEIGRATAALHRPLKRGTLDRMIGDNRRG